ncbi:MAG: Asp23/Gls24 family envelope stress response protein [Oscillospiraceae bacterium]|nr:Asp23/Gls24 family envelope stress response protein [Oscillospiraceae bacterium]
MPESYVTNHTEKGDISISEDVVALMVSAAISEIEGVSGLSNPTSTDLAERFGLKNAARGIRISSEGDVITVDVAIMVRYGYGVTVTAKKIQEQAAASVESMTGLAVRVNVHVTGIAFDKADMKG